MDKPQLGNNITVESDKKSDLKHAIAQKCSGCEQDMFMRKLCCHVAESIAPNIGKMGVKGEFVADAAVLELRDMKVVPASDIFGTLHLQS